MQALLFTLAVAGLLFLVIYQMYINLQQLAREEQEQRFERKIKGIIRHCERPTVHIECRGYEVDKL